MTTMIDDDAFMKAGLKREINQKHCHDKQQEVSAEAHKLLYTPDA
jgi:hypothetical protein